MKVSLCCSLNSNAILELLFLQQVHSKASVWCRRSGCNTGISHKVSLSASNPPPCWCTQESSGSWPKYLHTFAPMQPTWVTPVEVLAPAFSLAQSWLLCHLGSEPVNERYWSLPLSLSFDKALKKDTCLGKIGMSTSLFPVLKTELETSPNQSPSLHYYYCFLIF